MIWSFKYGKTEVLFAGERCHHRGLAFRVVVERRLAMLARAARLDDLRIPPQNRLETLKGDRKGQWSIRINDQ